MDKLVLELEGNESSLRTVFEVVEKVVLGVATVGSLNITKAVIEGKTSRIILDSTYARDNDPEQNSPRPIIGGGGLRMW